MNHRKALRALFEPESVALIGASGDERKNTSRPQRFLSRHGFAGKVFPVNPSRSEVFGRPAYPDIGAVPGGADHAFIMVPTAAVPAVIDDCAKAGVRVATIYTDGFAEAGTDGLARQQRLVSNARSKGIRILGPNSMGVVNVHDGVALTVNAVLELPRLVAGPLSVVSQSGSVIGTLLSRGQARGFGFAKLASVGNESDISVAEIVTYLAGDERTGAILLFLETLREQAALGAAARGALKAGKPVFVYKLGRSAAGRTLAATHSGAMTGAAEAVAAWFRHHGIVRLDTLDGLIEAPPLFAATRFPQGRRVAVMTTTGGGAATVADRLGTFGIELVPPPAARVERMRAHRVELAARQLVDLTMAGTRPEVAREALQSLLDSAECDLVVVVVGSSGQFHPELAVRPIIDAAAGRAKPVAVFILPEADASLRLLAEAGIAAFRTPEGCADAARAYLDWAPPLAPGRPKRRALTAAEGALAAARGPLLDERASGEVFRSLGLEVAASTRIDGPGRNWDLRFPVAVKLLSSGISHKTEIGGVILNLHSREEVDAACREITARVRQHGRAPAIEGFLVQEMVSGVAEALVGFHRDPEAGAVVTVGLGGTLAELHRDFAVRAAPVSRKSAKAMLDEVRGFAMLRGYRGLPRGDLSALAQAVSALSGLALLDAPAILEAEINPLIIRAEGEGVVAVDGVIRIDEVR
ncbi:MAG: acetate--CoA ligase family protein [Gammaproteobacteria bacterium]|nr:acetate--CoA ligase family protein [Gammaproteobacteria bacterium]